MIFPVDELIAQISKYFTLKIGDLIYTGTPAGVGPVKIGDPSGGRIEILEGLQAGDRIAVAGVSFLREGMKVRDLGDALGGN